MRSAYRRGEALHEVEATAAGNGRYTVVVDGIELHLTATRNGDALDLADVHGVVRAWVTLDGDRRFVTAPGLGEARLTRIDPGARGGARGDPGSDLASPMPGKVVKVLVAAGDAVRRGQPLVVVEAMKTELSVLAPRDGQVARVDAVAGAMCEAGRPLVELTPA